MGAKAYPPQGKLDLFQRAEELGRAAEFDILDFLSTGERRLPFRSWIYPSAKGGRHVPIFKILMSNSCSNNCLYCANRCGRDFPRYSLTPDELASAFIELYRRGLVEGIFLSSAVEDSPLKIMDNMIQAIEILRLKHKFQGYVHLKMMPGSGRDQVRRAVELADRVSVNLETTAEHRLRRISPNKDMVRELLPQVRWAKEFLEGAGASKSQTTQFIVGISKESDRELLSTCARLYRDFRLSRCYFSAFTPVPGTPLENMLPTPKFRERRLYQADLLLRRYGFEPGDLVFDGEGCLALDADPKLVWAIHHPELFPIEVNRAAPEELIKVPGIGPRSAQRIVEMRRGGKIKRAQELKLVGASLRRVAPFILLDGRRVERIHKQATLGEGQ